MKNKLVRLSHLSGDAASIYSIYYSNKEEVLFERFIRENLTHNPEETMNIVRRLRSIGKRRGVQDIYIKRDESLEWNDGVCALYDVPEKHLRLYCIHVSEKILIIGSGGCKSRDIRKWQEDRKLSAAVHEMMHFSRIVNVKLEHGSLYLSEDGLTLEGNMVLIH